MLANISIILSLSRHISGSQFILTICSNLSWHMDVWILVFINLSLEYDLSTVQLDTGSVTVIFNVKYKFGKTFWSDAVQESLNNFPILAKFCLEEFNVWSYSSSYKLKSIETISFSLPEFSTSSKSSSLVIVCKFDLSLIVDSISL